MPTASGESYGPICRHCRCHKTTRRLGLCRICYYNLAVRAKYCTVNKYGRRSSDGAAEAEIKRIHEAHKVKMEAAIDGLKEDAAVMGWDACAELGRLLDGARAMARIGKLDEAANAVSHLAERHAASGFRLEKALR